MGMPALDEVVKQDQRVCWKVASTKKAQKARATLPEYGYGSRTEIPDARGGRVDPSVLEES